MSAGPVTSFPTRGRSNSEGGRPPMVSKNRSKSATHSPVGTPPTRHSPLMERMGRSGSPHLTQKNSKMSGSNNSIDLQAITESLPSARSTPAPAGPAQRYKATYFGTVSVPITLRPDEIPETVHRVMKGTSLDDMIDVWIDVRMNELKIISAKGMQAIKVVTPEALHSSAISSNDSRVIVFFTRMVESRVPLLHGHVFATEAEMAIQIKESVDSSLPEPTTTVLEESGYMSPPVEPVPQAELLTVDAFYLGYVRVNKKEGGKIVKRAADVNAAGRAAMKQARDQQKIRKSGILQGGAITTKGGITVEEDPVTVVVTPRSLRIVDRLAGETLFKTLIANITFATSAPVGKGRSNDLFGCIVVNERLSIYNCHLFYVNPNDTSLLVRGVGEALQRCKQEFGEGALAKNSSPWAVNPEAKRQSAPAVLFTKQIHRSDLKPLAVIGAGEYGEVFLALQSILVQSRSTGDKQVVRVPRAVKMAAVESMKDDFVREALIMLRLGSHENIVRLVGVAVQQSPWLAVLEFVQYGDLRAVVKACAEDNIKLDTGEQINYMRQLCLGCHHINSLGILHMDLAARNCLVGLNNVVKVGDFGMSRMMCDDGPYLILNHKIPLALKWMSVEAMDSRFFSEGSDCWSFGVLMWEVLTYGAYPYAGLQLDRIQVLVREGLRLERPEDCPSQLWEVVSKCWHLRIRERWKFADLVVVLHTLQKQYPRPTRDLGRVVAGAAPPSWALVDPNTGENQSTSTNGRVSPQVPAQDAVKSTRRSSAGESQRRRSSLGQSIFSAMSGSPSRTGSGGTRRSRSKSNASKNNVQNLQDRDSLPVTQVHGSEPNFSAGRMMGNGPLSGKLPASKPGDGLSRSYEDDLDSKGC